LKINDEKHVLKKETASILWQKTTIGIGVGSSRIVWILCQDSAHTFFNEQGKCWIDAKDINI
jgi:hypothetical protein